MNKLIIDQFNQLIKQIQAEYLNAQVENDVKEMTSHSYRLQSVRKALNIIKKLDFEIADANDLKGIPNIGKGTLQRIEEILKTGHLSEIKSKYGKKKQAKISGIQELRKVIGIGDKLAKKLVVENGIMSVNDLKKAIKDGKIEVNKKILLGLKYYGVIKTDIPRKEITAIEKYLKKVTKRIDPKLEIVICGSYRRGKKTSGDVDVLMFHPDMKTTNHIRNPQKFGLKQYLEEFVKELKKEDFLLDYLTDKAYKQKFMAFCKFKDNPVRRIDIRLIPYNSLYTALLYFTGPAELNEAMRHQAKRRGMTLNEYGLYKVDEEGNQTLIKTDSEKEIFEILGMKYLTPEQREYYYIGK